MHSLWGLSSPILTCKSENTEWEDQDLLMELLCKFEQVSVTLFLPFCGARLGMDDFEGKFPAPFRSQFNLQVSSCFFFFLGWTDIN